MKTIKTLTVNGEQYALDVSGCTYYTSLSAAVADINSGVTDNTVSDTAEAKVKVFTAENGAKIAMLLEDISESVQIDIAADLDLVLNGKTLTLTTYEAYLNFLEGTNCTINGEVAGSMITKTVAYEAKSVYVCRIDGMRFSAHGGMYHIEARNAVDASAITMAFRIGATTELAEFEHATLQVVGGNHIARAIQTQAVRVTLCNVGCNIKSQTKAEIMLSTSTVLLKGVASTVDGGNGTATGIQNAGILKVEDSEIAVTGKTAICGLNNYGVSSAVEKTRILVNASEASAFGIQNSCVLNVKDSEITAIGEMHAYGLVNTASVSDEVIIENSKVLADAPGDNADEECATGIVNVGVVICKNTDVTGTLSGLQNNDAAKCYVSGGTFTGYSHGGFYFVHGADGIAYVNDAAIRCGNYEGVYEDVFAGDTVAPYANFYVADGAEESNPGTSVYLDGCTLGTEDLSVSTFVLRGTSGEKNSVVNISNSTKKSTGAIRVDANCGHKLRLGIGTDTLTSNNSADTERTGALYRRIHPDTPMNGRDYNALTAYMASKE